MRKFCISVLFVAATVFAGDRLIGRLLHENMKFGSASLAKLYYETTDIREDIICLGSSRCENHYVSSILADSLNCTVYNAGWSNSRIYAYFYILHQILEVHTPKLICLDVKRTDYLYDTDDDSFSAVLHYASCFGRVAEADEVFRESGDYIPFRLSAIYRYNARIFDYIRGLLSPGPYKPSLKGGYEPSPPVSRGEGVAELRNSNVDRPYDPRKIDYFKRFIELCQKNGIELIISVSPFYSHASEDLYAKPKELAVHYGIPVFDYHSGGLFLDHPEYFRDKQHMTDEGARAFTSIFAHDLKEYLAKTGEGDR